MSKHSTISMFIVQRNQVSDCNINQEIGIKFLIKAEPGAGWEGSLKLKSFTKKYKYSFLASVF